MSTYVLIHGGGETGWAWHLVAAELRSRGHEVVTPDLPGDDDAATLIDYADTVMLSGGFRVAEPPARGEASDVTVVAAVGDRTDLVVVGHSFGGFTAPLVADRLAADLLVLVAGMIPAPGESPDDWGRNTGCGAAVQAQAARDGGRTGHPDPYVGFYHDVPRALADEALSKERAPPRCGSRGPWPRGRTCAPGSCCAPKTAASRRLAAERLGIVPDEITAGHCVALSRPTALADLLESYR